MSITLEQVQAQADAILRSLGIARTRFQQREMDFAVGDARIKELGYLRDLIDELSAAPTHTERTRCTYASSGRGDLGRTRSGRPWDTCP
jgi:hypothetical protein